MADTPQNSETAAREALKPFASFADPNRKVPADMTITAGSRIARRQLTMGDCYAAADALALRTASSPGEAWQAQVDRAARYIADQNGSDRWESFKPFAEGILTAARTGSR